MWYTGNARSQWLDSNTVYRQRNPYIKRMGGCSDLAGSYWTRNQWQLEADAVDGAKGARVFIGKAGVQTMDQFVYSCLWIKSRTQVNKLNIFWTTVIGRPRKQCLLIKITHAVVYTYRLLFLFISQYSDKVDFILMGELQFGRQSQTGTRAPWPPLEAATARNWEVTGRCLAVDTASDLEQVANLLRARAS